MTTTTIQLQKGRHKRLESGHPWVFSNEVQQGQGPTPELGQLVEVRRVDGAYLGAGLFHPNSLIAVRLLTRGDAPGELDRDFFEQRLVAAQERRRRGLGEAQATPPAGYRLCHGEADGLPGLVIDRYGDVVVVQIACAGIEQRKEALYDALEALFEPRAVVERNDTVWRQQEGLPPDTGVARGALPEDPVFVEHGLTYGVDVLGGQKTGWFLDQRDHRLAVRPWAAGARVLDLCCYQGGFSLNALAGGARSVLAVDVSEPALERVRDNASRNGLAKGLETLRADVMELALSGPPGGAPFDLVVLDPPNFTRSRKTVPKAKRAYRKLNEAALGWLAPGGVLATASCSHHIYEETFVDILGQSAAAAGRPVRVLYRGYQPADHPVLLAMPETRYLKFFLVQPV